MLTTHGEPRVIIGPVADHDGGSAGTARRAVGVARARELPPNLEREHTEKIHGPLIADTRSCEASRVV